jgi:hypothetical protein
MTPEVDTALFELGRLFGRGGLTSRQIAALIAVLRDHEASGLLATKLDELIGKAGKDDVGATGGRSETTRPLHHAMALEGPLVSAIQKAKIRRLELLDVMRQIAPGFGEDFDARKASSASIVRRFLMVSTLEQGRTLFSMLGFPIQSDPYLDGIVRDE